MVELFLIKILDNLILTARSISTYKNKEILTSILVVISQFLFYFVVKGVLDDTSNMSILVVSLASGIGTYLAFKVNNRFKRDVMWTNIITCKDRMLIQNLCDILIKNKIKYIVNDSYSRGWEPRYSLMIFTQTKDESKIVDCFLENMENKYLRQILK